MNVINESKIVYRLKALALVSIVAAHSPYTMLNNGIVLSFFQRFSTVGVVIFFFLSGYYYSVDGFKQKYNFSKFWKKKIKNLIIPWLVNGSLYFILLTVSGTKQMNGLEYINFIIGNGSVLYYLTMLCICYLICWNFLKRKTFLWGCVIVTIISVLLTGCEKNGTYLNMWNPYMNVLNWIGFFAFGILAKRNNWNIILKKLTTKKNAGTTMVVCTIFAIMFMWLDNNNSYWSACSIPIEILLATILLILAIKCPRKMESALEYVGSITLPIYLWHIPIQNRVLVGEYLMNSVFIAAIRPIATIALMAIVIYGLKLITRLLHIENIYCLLLGVRK